MSPVVLVTGAGRGLGRAMALALVRSGYVVIGTTRSHPDDADEVIAAAGSPNISFLSFDSTAFDRYGTFVDAVRRRLSEQGADVRLHALVNNAGSGVLAAYDATTADQLDAMWDVNLKAPFLLTQALLPLIPPGGRVLNVTSAVIRGVVPGLSAYAAAKAGLVTLTRYQAEELSGRGIAVNVLMGGAVDTGFGGGMMHSDQAKESAERDTAWHTMATPDEMVASVPAILGPEFRRATGSVIDMSGGQSI